jgi:hypothetical protein
LEVEVDLVAKYMGDGVLGYFGYPQAHEDDAERAVRAGLAIVEAAPTLQTAAGVPLHVRVGIATGIVPPQAHCGRPAHFQRIRSVDQFVDC